MIEFGQGILWFLQGLQHVGHEILVFAAFWFVIGLFDEFAVDLSFFVLKVTGRARSRVLPEGYGSAELRGPMAVMIPAWQEAAVIATTLRHALSAWPQVALRIYVGCYGNDRHTLAAAMRGAAGDPRVRLVILDHDGPTTKADCLNRLYRAVCHDEARGGNDFRGILLHDAEDMVHPAALTVIDDALASVDFVQLPVRPEPNPHSPWIAGHYADEFTEAHAKTMVVRSVLGAGIPAAGVGCGFARAALTRIAEDRGRAGGLGPFAAECLTEDYELGLVASRSGRGARFVRLRDADGNLVATRSFFPARLDLAVRQKTRWIHGIAFQAWDRMGWGGQVFDVWMALRDRRGPLIALVLAAAYLLLVIDAVLWLARDLGLVAVAPLSPAVRAMLLLTFFGFVWRAAMRLAFTTSEYGWREGLRSLLRIPVGNIIAIMAGRRALAAYLGSLRGAPLVWDKTLHLDHPAGISPLPISLQAAR